LRAAAKHSVAKDGECVLRHSQHGGTAGKADEQRAAVNLHRG
jgi:hypothetical protein